MARKIVTYKAADKPRAAVKVTKDSVTVKIGKRVVFIRPEAKN